MDTHEEFTTAVDDAIPRYAPRFVEASPAALERELPYLLTLAPRGFFWFDLREPPQ